MSIEKNRRFADFIIAMALFITSATVWAQDENPSAQDDVSWKSEASVGGVPYQSVEELRSFYKLESGVKAHRKGAFAVSNTDVNLEFGPESNNMSINGVHISLSRPLVRNTQGKLMVSREDWVQWIDPIMRPTYIAGREDVQTVIIDAGHGGHDKGVQIAGESEARITLRIAERLQNELQKIGIRAVLTRSGDYFLSDQQRVDAANVHSNAIFLSLHINSGASERKGSEVYILSPLQPLSEAKQTTMVNTPRSAALAYTVQCALSTLSGVLGGGCQSVHFSLLTSLNMPSVWIELGYATNTQDAAQLAAPTYHQKLAETLAEAVTTYVRYVSPQGKLEVIPPRPPSTKPAKQPSSQNSPARSNRDPVRRGRNTNRRPQGRKPGQTH